MRIEVGRRCSACDAVNPGNFKFCGECGHKLAITPQPASKELSADEKLQKIQRYLPKGIAEKILSQRDRIEGEHKQAFGARFIAEIYMHIDDHHMIEAESWINHAIGFNTKYDTKWELARDHVVYAEWFFKSGDVAKAKEQLTRAIGLFEKCGADGWLEKYEKELATL